MVAPVGTIGQQIRHAAQLLRASRHAVALSGAGVSAESGIPTYRSQGGLWTRLGEPTIDGWELFQNDPQKWWELALEERSRNNEFAQAIERAEPNPAHHAMAEMEESGRLAHLITQNIDNLHRRAGSKHLTEIHGNRWLVRCTNCGARDRLETISLDRLPPLCPECGGILKNDVVMFGEPIPDDALRSAYKQALSSDLFLVVGTSAVVYPAAEFPIMAKRQGGPLIEVNPEETALSEIADAIIRAPAGEALPEIMELLQQQL